MTETEYAALHRRLWQLVAEYDEILSTGSAELAERLIERLRQDGWGIGPETAAALNAYFEEVEQTLRDGIRSATRLGSPTAMRDALVARLTEEAFVRRWDDGKNLSTRLWDFRQGTTAGLGRVLADGARTGRSIGALVYDLQREIEAVGSTFEIRHTNFDDWAMELADAAKAVIKNPKAADHWRRTVNQVRHHLDELADSGTRHAAETAFKRILQAVEAGQTEILSDAVYWWQYDKQLYLLKRIARTEMATAQHRAVIVSTEEDPDVIGYHWRLSSSHPEPDICDYYAGIEMGLGRGVWPKDQVPRHKAHPHCMCLLVPRVTPVKDKGALTYAEFITGMATERRAKLLPKWAQEAIRNGTPLAQLIRPDGLGLVTQKEVAL